jgi:hypothetical protein
MSNVTEEERGFAGHTAGPWHWAQGVQGGDEWQLEGAVEYADMSPILVAFDCGCKVDNGQCPMAPKAADRHLIAAAPALLAERDRLQAECDTLAERNGQHAIEEARLRAEVERLEATVTAYAQADRQKTDRVRDLEAQQEKLVEALRGLHNCIGWSDSLQHYEVVGRIMDELLQARAALAAVEGRE